MKFVLNAPAVLYMILNFRSAVLPVLLIKSGILRRRCAIAKKAFTELTEKEFAFSAQAVSITMKRLYPVYVTVLKLKSGPMVSVYVKLA